MAEISVDLLVKRIDGAPTSSPQRRRLEGDSSFEDQLRTHPHCRRLRSDQLRKRRSGGQISLRHPNKKCCRLPPCGTGELEVLLISRVPGQNAAIPNDGLWLGTRGGGQIIDCAHQYRKCIGDLVHF